MKVSGRLKRIAAVVSAVGFLSGAVIAANPEVASASVVANHEVVFCATGNYTARVIFPYSDIGYFIVQPKTCWSSYVPGNEWQPIKVYGFWNSNPGQFYIGTEWYNGSVSGIGISAGGITTHPYLQTW